MSLHVMAQGRSGMKDGPLAQLVEQLTFNQWVAGSNPARLTIFLTETKGLQGVETPASPSLFRLVTGFVTGSRSEKTKVTHRLLPFVNVRA